MRGVNSFEKEPRGALLLSQAGRNVRFLILVAVLVASLPLALVAQQNVGGITGRVTDPSDAVVPGAKVVALHQPTGREREGVTNQDGIYTLKLLQIGEYTLTVKAAGFKSFQRAGIPVVSGETATVDIKIEVGQVTETVTVTGEAPVMDTTQSMVGTTRTNQEIADLPITLAGNSSRSAAAFARTVTGVNWEPRESGGQDFMVVSRAQISGSMGGTWGYQIDGVEAGMGEGESGSDFMSPIPDTVQEFRLSSNADASSGFNGGVAMQMTLKSGTNDFHGNAFWYVRNDALNARYWFDTSGKATLDKQNEVGFTVGGPIWKNKTFFFTSLDIYRYSQAQGGVVATVPTALIKQGDFSELLGPQIGTDALGRPILQGQIYDPLTTRSDGAGGFIRDPFAGNIIPSSRLSPISLKLQQGWASPTRAGTQLNWVGTNRPIVVDKNQWYLKVDHNLNPRHRFSFAYEAVVPWFKRAYSGLSGHSYIVGGSSFLAPEITNGFLDDRDSYRYRFSYLWTVTPQMIFNFRAGVTRNPHRVLAPYPYVGAAATFGRDAGVTGVLNPRTPAVNVQGVGSFGVAWGGFGRNLFASQRTPFNADVTWSKGSHNLKMGAEYIALPMVVVTEGGASGTFNFNDVETGLPGRTKTGAGYASFLLGEVDSGNVASPFDEKTYVAGWALYAQDQWRVRPKLVLNYGLRWDLFVPMRESQTKIASFDPNLANPGAGGRLGALSVYGPGAGRNGLTTVADYYYKAFAPNLGFAYEWNPKTVVRGSYGISYYPYWKYYHSSYGTIQPTTGFSASLTSSSLDNGVTPAFNWNGGFPLAFPVFPRIDPSLVNGSSIGFIDRADNRPPMAQNITLEVGRELPRGISARVAWVANLAHRLPSSGLVDLNAIDLSYLRLGSLLTANINSPEAIAAGIPLPYAGFKGSVAQALRPYPQYQSIPGLAAQVGNSSYHSAQINVQKRMGDQTFLVGYTISKQLTNVDFPGYANSGAGVIQHPQLLNTGKHLLGLDRPQILNVSWAYALPFGSGKRFLGGSSGPVNQIVGGWRLSAIQNYMSGRALRVTSRARIPGGFYGIWPLRVPDVPIVATSCGDLKDPFTQRQLNPAAFATPAPFTLGDTAVLPNVRGCGFFDEALEINKRFRVTERVGIDFGSMLMNLFNRHSWNAPNTDIGNTAAFGKVSGSTPPRSIQFYLKVAF